VIPARAEEDEATAGGEHRLGLGTPSPARALAGAGWRGRSSWGPTVWPKPARPRRRARALGSLEVVDGHRPLALGPPQQRALLAMLLIHRREPVSSDQLVDALWGERAPSSAVKLVQGNVSNPRKVLGEGLPVTRGRG